MPHLRITRDKRGYEHFYLVEPSARRGRVRTRILYWFRTPPGVRVGRRLFDPDVREAIEERYPDLEFDWDKLLQTPIPPPPEAEKWRERRRLAKAAKAAALEDEAEFEATEPVDAVEPAPAGNGSRGAEGRQRPPEAHQGETDSDRAEPVDGVPGEAVVAAAPAGVSPGSDESRPTGASAARRRRRRRGGRKNRRPGPDGQVEAGGGEASASPEADDGGDTGGEDEPSDGEA